MAIFFRFAGKAPIAQETDARYGGWLTAGFLTLTS
jgi:hypothetical protein